VLLEGDHAALAVLQGVGQAAGLGAVAPVGAAAGLGVADVALAREGDAERAVDEVLDHHIVRQRRMHGGDFLEAEFARQHDLREARVGEEARLGRRADVALRRGVQVNGWQVEFQQAHVLHDQRVHAGVPAVPREAARRLQFGVGEDGVEGDVDARVEASRI